MRWTERHNRDFPETSFQIRGGRKRTGFNNSVSEVGKAVTPKRLRRRAGHLCELLSCPIDTFSAMAITVSALSYSAISPTSPPPPPQPPNPILQSSSSCSPGLSIFYFPFSPPSSSPLSSSSFHLLKHTSHSSACLSEAFFFSPSLSFTLLLDLVRVSPL